jgi:hypothetical protein
MNTKDYVVDLPDPDVQYRVRFDVSKGKITNFMVQLEYNGPDGWQPVLRFDTAHGFAHCDRYDPDGNVQRHESIPRSEYGEGLTYAIAFVKAHYATLAQPFREQFT